MQCWCRFFTYLLLVVVGLLLCIGLVMIYSTTFDSRGNYFFYRQFVWIGCGVVAAVVLSLIKLEWLARYSHYFLLAVALALTYLFACMLISKLVSVEAALKMPFMPGEIKGGYRWLRLAGRVMVQPSEFAKPALLLFLASYYGTRDEETIGKFVKGFLIPGALCGYVLAMILLGKDLSTTVITGMMVFGIMFLAGVRIRYLLPMALIAVALGTTMIVSSPMRMRRITSFMAPSSGGKDKGDRYQLDHSEMALGGGGLKGRGFTKSLMKNNYLPESHTDFIVAVLGEELGFLGVLLVISLYALFLMCVVGISRGCHDKVGLLICLGVGILIPFQAVINIGVVSGWLPTTGLTAPFLSYGGSSMVSTLMCMGLVFNVSMRNMNAIALDNQRMSVVPTTGYKEM